MLSALMFGQFLTEVWCSTVVRTRGGRRGWVSEIKPGVGQMCLNSLRNRSVTLENHVVSSQSPRATCSDRLKEAVMAKPSDWCSVEQPSLAY